MKINQLHIYVFCLTLLCCQQWIMGLTAVQTPQQERHFDDNFKARYSSDKFNYEGQAIVGQTPNGSGIYEDYKNKKPKLKEEDNPDYFSFNLGPLSLLFYAAIILAVIALAYILLKEGGSGFFSSKQHKKLNHYENITAENIEHTDISVFIKKAEDQEDFRLAIRYFYLLVLKNLSLKNHIKFEDDKTNSEYLNELSGTAFSERFAYISYLYNYIWYGKFPVNLEQYTQAKSNFTTLLNLVK